MAKRIGRSDIIGERGIAYIRQVVLSMGWMFYETGGVEAGIDGFIELRDETTGAVGNLVLQVQGKATERERLQAETEQTFEFPCTKEDITYWMQGTAPVLLLLVRPEEGLAYWKSIKDWFSDTEHLKARKVVFDKAGDAFTRDAKPAIAAVALSASPGASSPSVRTSEELLANLVRIGFAPTLYWAPTDYPTDKAFGAALRDLDPKAASEWIVRSKSVLSFHNLDSWPWNQLCESAAMEEFGSDEWAYGDDEDRQRNFVALLNRAMSEFVRPDLWRDRDHGTFFFAKPKKRNRLRYAYQSLKSFVPRDVVKRYGKRRDNPTQPSYWRHSAFLHRFVRLGSEWYAEVTPTYHFTRDGYHADAWAGERLKKIKEFENNAAVMGQFVMWRSFLTTHGAADLYSDRYPFLSFSIIEPFVLDVGVPDELWKSQEVNPNSPLFDWAQAEDGG
ncbi:MAG: DUF4365 domain-containing protein [bacterium]|nr:DUF4365 domain-containing protein [bacterium]